jgi:endonuclease-3
MQSDQLANKAARVHHLLREHYGEPQRRRSLDPLSELVLTILSQNTSDVNSGRAFDALRQRFPVWEDVMQADTQQVADAIRMGGLSQIKAPRIQAILRQLDAERGQLSLDFLNDMTVEQAREYLTALHGVGPKTAACVLLFSLNKPAFPVDTHVHRVGRRIGLFPLNATPEKASALLEELVPEASYYSFHVLLIWHGRRICKASAPRCEVCPVKAECNYYWELVEAEESLKS